MSDNDRKARGRPPSSRSAVKTPKYEDFYVYSDNSDEEKSYHTSMKKARPTKKKVFSDRVTRNSKLEVNTEVKPTNDTDSSDNDCLSTYVTKANIYKVESDFNFHLNEQSSEPSIASISDGCSEEICTEIIPQRSPSPIVDEILVESLILPPSSEDLSIDPKLLMTVLGLYETLRHFSLTIRLSPFLFEDFLTALHSREQCALLSETHIALLRYLLKEVTHIIQLMHINKTLFNASVYKIICVARSP